MEGMGKVLLGKHVIYIGTIMNNWCANILWSTQFNVVWRFKNVGFGIWVVIPGSSGWNRVSWGTSLVRWSSISRTDTSKSWAQYPVCGLQNYRTTVMTLRNLLHLKSRGLIPWFVFLLRETFMPSKFMG